MKQSDNHGLIEMKENPQSLQSLFKSNTSNTTNSREDLQYWRQRILDAIYTIFFYCGFIAYIPSIYVAITEDAWVIAVVDTVVIGAVFVIHLTEWFSFTVKVYLLLFFLYLIAIVLMINIYVGYSLVWIFVTPMMVGLLMGVRASIVALSTNLFILICYAFLLYYDDTVLWDPVADSQLLGWLILSINFFLLNLVTTFSVVTLVEKLKFTIIAGDDINAELDKEKTKLEEEIKHRIEAEKEKEVVTRKLHQASKMEAIGLMAGGVAHDLNNILSGLVTYPELMAMKLPKDSDMQKPLRTIINSGHRAADVVADLLTVARGVASEKTSYSLNTIVTDYLESPEASALFSNYPNIIVNKKLTENNLNIYCSITHIFKSLMNLVTNSVEAIGESGSVTISTRLETITDKAGSLGIYPGTYAVLDVLDSGKGISENVLSHIFEPFYTKKVMGRSGTGLGLTIVQNTMSDHEGCVFVSSDENGTCFSLYFPTTEHYSEESSAISDSQIDGNGEIILVIDDDFAQRAIATDLLESLNYCVVTVQSGEAAIEYLNEKSADLIMLDMLMPPGMNGLETYHEIIKFRPKQKSIIVSGYSDSEIVSDAKESGVLDFLMKPYTREKLALTIRKHLLEE